MKNKGLISALILVTSFNVNAAVLIVDDFEGDYGGISSVDSTVAPVTLTQGGAGILGGSRYLEIIKTSTAGDPPITPPQLPLGADLAVLDLSGLGGILAFSNDTLTTSFASVGYGFSSIDLIAGLYDSLQVDFISADLGFEYAVILYTDANNWTAIESSLAAVTFPGPSTDTVSLDLFAAANCGTTIGGRDITCAGGGGIDAVDLTNLTALGLGFANTLPGIDLVLDDIRFVPAPNALALIGLGLLAFGFVSRRKVNVASTLQA